MNPYYQDDQITVYLGDCRDILPMLGGVYFTFSDPPYNAKKDYKGWNDNMPPAEYLEFCRQWITQVQRLSNAVCLMVPKLWFLEYWIMLGREYQQIVMPYTPEGVYRAGFINQFHSLLTNAIPQGRVKNVWGDVKHSGMGYFFHEDSFDHPGYTSEDLTAKVLTRLADPNLPILDPFGGTGTTARIAKNLGRKCVTIEYSEYWAEFIVTRRLSQANLFTYDNQQTEDIYTQRSFGVEE